MELLSWQSAQALGFVGALVAGAVAATVTFAPKASTKIQLIYVWLAFDALCHMICERYPLRCDIAYDAAY